MRRVIGEMARNFRDRPAQFPSIGAGFDTGYLESRGPVATPRRVDAPAPVNVTTLPVRRSFVGREDRYRKGEALRLIE